MIAMCPTCGGHLIDCAICGEHIHGAAYGQTIHDACDPRSPVERAAPWRATIREAAKVFE